MRLILTLMILLWPAGALAENRQTAIVAGGCFWCVEADFDKIPGVLETLSGYTGGHLENPTYRQVTAGGTGHVEAVRITFDADRIDFEALMNRYWRLVDPTDPGGQFCDRGDSYRTAIFALDAEQARVAARTRDAAEAVLGQRIVTPILEATTFWPAEDFHQDYARRNPIRYAFYRRGCGRDARLQELWGDAAFTGG